MREGGRRTDSFFLTVTLARQWATAEVPLEPLSDLRREVFRTRPTLKMTRRMDALESAVEGEADSAATASTTMAMQEDKEEAEAAESE